MAGVMAQRLESLLPSLKLRAVQGPHQEFFIDAVLGEGAFAHVVRAKDTAGNVMALKLIEVRQAASVDDVERDNVVMFEARVHYSLSGEPSIVPCLNPPGPFKATWVEEKTVRQLAVIPMPVATANMMQWIHSHPPGEFLDHKHGMLLWLQMFNSIRVCHHYGLVHKDVKLDNFLIFNTPNSNPADAPGRPVPRPLEYVRLTDFGLTALQGQRVRHIAGTPWNMSPAAFKMQDDGICGDFWSLGVCLFQLLQHGEWPFKKDFLPWVTNNPKRKEAAIEKAVSEGKILWRMDLPPPARELIQGLCNVDPNRRWGVRQVLCSAACSPSLLQELAFRRPELAEDMQQMLELQTKCKGETLSMGCPVKPIGSAAMHAPLLLIAHNARSGVAAAPAILAPGKHAAAATHVQQEHTERAHGVPHSHGSMLNPLLALQGAVRSISVAGRAAGNAELSEPLVAGQHLLEEEGVHLENRRSQAGVGSLCKPSTSLMLGQSGTGAERCAATSGVLQPRRSSTLVAPKGLAAGSVRSMHCAQEDEEGAEIDELTRGPAARRATVTSAKLANAAAAGAETAMKGMWCGLRRMFNACSRKPAVRYDAL